MFGGSIGPGEIDIAKVVAGKLVQISQALGNLGIGIQLFRTLQGQYQIAELEQCRILIGEIHEDILILAPPLGKVLGLLPEFGIVEGGGEKLRGGRAGTGG